MSVSFPSLAGLSAAGIQVAQRGTLGQPPSLYDTPDRGDNGVRVRDIETRSTQYEVDQQVDLDLALTTAEGDKVSIRYDFDRSQSYFSGTVRTNLQQATLQESTEETASRVQLRIEGDLNAEERAAIDGLLEKVEATVSQFLGSEDGAYVDHALALGADPAVLSAFSLNLNVTESITATSTYQQLSVGRAPGYGQAGPSIGGNANHGLLASLAELGKLHKNLVDVAQEKFQQQDSARLIGATVPLYLSSYGQDLV
ncbi:MAG: hypothetical protein AAF541_08405 [Pseudomonadota bacterium]